MKHLISLAATMAIAATVAMPIAAQEQASANQAPPGQTIKGGDCYELKGRGESQFNCTHLGLVKNTREIYEKGFKVVAVFIRDTGRYFVIEQQ